MEVDFTHQKYTLVNFDSANNNNNNNYCFEQY